MCLGLAYEIQPRNKQIIEVNVVGDPPAALAAGVATRSFPPSNTARDAWKPRRGARSAGKARWDGWDAWRATREPYRCLAGLAERTPLPTTAKAHSWSRDGSVMPTSFCLTPRRGLGWSPCRGRHRRRL